MGEGETVEGKRRRKEAEAIVRPQEAEVGEVVEEEWKREEGEGADGKGEEQ